MTQLQLMHKLANLGEDFLDTFIDFFDSVEETSQNVFENTAKRLMAGE